MRARLTSGAALALGLLAGGPAGCGAQQRGHCNEQPSGCPRSVYAMDVAALQRGLARQQLHVLDLRDAAAYAAGHVPGAVHLDREAVRAVVGGVAGQVAPARQVTAALAAAGVQDGDSIVAYDADNGPAAARLLWTLIYYGWSPGRVHVLDGGFAAWTEAGGALDTTEPPRGPPRTVTLAPPSNARRVDAPWVRKHLGTGQVALLDARGHEEYLAGHIPGALHVPWESTRSGTRFIDDDALVSLYGEALTAPTVITYCDTGLRASLLWLTLKMLGHADVRVYDGSWTEWSARPDLPKAVGGEPGTV